MSDSDLQAQTTAAKAYEEFFVPALFGEWATVSACCQRQRGVGHDHDPAWGGAVPEHSVNGRG